MTGTVHGVTVQAGNITGNVHLHNTSQPLQSLPHRVGLVPLRATFFLDRPDVTLTPGKDSSSDENALRTTVLTGLGGVGKTQLAAEYAESLWKEQDVDLLVWITAQSRSAIVTTYARAAQDILDNKENNDQINAERFVQWLASTDKRWLIVLDDVANPADLRGLWPPTTPSGQVVLTTRRQDAALRSNKHRFVKLEEFTLAESTAYLSTNFDEYPNLLDGAEELAEELGNLPLALSQAAAYMIDRRLSCGSYLGRFRERNTTLRALFPEQDSLPDGYNNAATATWSLSLELANKLTPQGLAKPLLAFLSLLDPNGIPIELFRHEGVLRFLNGETGRFIGKDDAVDALGCLHRLSLVSFASAPLTSPDPQVVRVHALVQRATRETLSSSQLRFATMAASVTLLDTWDDHTNDQARQQIFRSNTHALRTNGDQWIWNASALLARVGESLADSSLLREAVHYLESLHHSYIERCGHRDSNTLYVQLQLARCRGYSRDIRGAIEEFRDLIDHCHTTFEPNDHRTLMARNSLATWEALADPNGNSVSMLKKILADSSRIFGEYSEESADVSCRLTVAQEISGDPLGALRSANESLSRHLQTFGPADERTLRARVTRAVCLGGTGNHLAALSELQELLLEHEQLFGHDHSRTLSIRGNIGNLQGEAGLLSSAVESLHFVVNRSTELFGAYSSRTLHFRGSLARWQSAHGDIEGVIHSARELANGHSELHGKDSELAREARVLLNLAQDKLRRNDK